MVAHKGFNPRSPAWVGENLTHDALKRSPSGAPNFTSVLLSRDNVRVKCSGKMSVVFCDFSDGEVDGLAKSKLA